MMQVGHCNLHRVVPQVIRCGQPLAMELAHLVSILLHPLDAAEGVQKPRGSFGSYAIHSGHPISLVSLQGKHLCPLQHTPYDI